MSRKEETKLPAGGGDVVRNGAPSDAEQRLRSVIESILAGIVLVDEAGTITMVNRQTEVIFGYSREELSGRPIEVLLPEHVRQEHRSRVEAYLQNPRPRETTSSRDVLGLRKDGRSIHVQVPLNPLPLHDRLFVLASVLDVTEQQRAAQLIASVVEYSADGAVMVDQH